MMWFCLACSIAQGLPALAPATDPARPSLRLEQGHLWRPPFGLDRVGTPLEAWVEFPSSAPAGESWLLIARRLGQERRRDPVSVPASPPARVRIPVASETDELMLVRGSPPIPEGEPKANAPAARIAIPEIDATAVAHAVPSRNPVDSGAILVPARWVCLGPGQTVRVELAAFARRAEAKDLTLTAFFDSNPSRVVTRSLNLAPAQKALAEFAFLDPSRDRDRDTLKLQLSSRDGRTLWSQSIPIVIVREPPRLPAFGATSLKLRFDAPISLRDPKTGAFSTLPYENGWDPKLNDVVVSLPNGARFVFWRGSSYIPFWAGVRNTGLCYEWAEQLNRPADAVDCVEPLMDKELRYGRVKIVESTPARVHVRWRYQSTDLHYKVWGDEAVEDYYFYPDGFGTRVLTLKADPAADYELAELIILAPQEAYPFQVLPRAPITLIGHDGSVHPVEFPVDRAREAETRARVKPPVIYSVSLDPSDPLRAILYNPRDSELAPLWFGHFQEGAEIVTPAYWGSHWPLARGNATGSAIDDRIAVTPSHNSLMSWAKSKPRPVSERLIETHDAQGRARTMIERRWVWLIGMSAESNQELIARSRSFASPPSIALSGARLAFDSAIHERRAIGIEVESPRIEIRLAPQTLIKNPVFELSCAPASQPRVELNGHALPANDFAWDGRVLWINRTIDRETQIIITFPDQDSSR